MFLLRIIKNIQFNLLFFFIVKHLTVLSRPSFNMGVDDYLECTTLYVCYWCLNSVTICKYFRICDEKFPHIFGYKRFLHTLNG